MARQCRVRSLRRIRETDSVSESCTWDPESLWIWRRISYFMGRRYECQWCLQNRHKQYARLVQRFGLFHDQ